VARAKSTDRAEARRRYRASLAEAAAAEEATSGEETEDGTGPTASQAASGASDRVSSTAHTTGSGGNPQKANRTQGRGSSSAEPAARPGITASFRAALRPVDVRSDLQYAPTLILHTRAVWIPALAVIASGALALLVPSNQITSLLAQIFVAPPSLAGPFLAGILAPRATYLAGGIVGLVAAIVLIIAIVLIPTSLLSAGNIDRGPIILYAIVVSPLFGLGVGGFAGYYRRFLYLSNPNAQRRSANQRSGKPAPKRR